MSPKSFEDIDVTGEMTPEELDKILGGAPQEAVSELGDELPLGNPDGCNRWFKGAPEEASKEETGI